MVCPSNPQTGENPISKKVLIVEDQSWRYQGWERELGDKVVVIRALSIKTAEEEFTANPDLDAIAVDACVPGEYPNTLPLVQKFRETFAGPMIAISSAPEFQTILMEAGCDHESTKDNLPRKIFEVLGI